LNTLQKQPNSTINYNVFIISTILIVLFISLTLFDPKLSKESLEIAKSWTLSNFDWLFVATTNIVLLFMLYLLLSPYGKIKLGGKDAQKEFSTISWIGMLFCAGMGIGLMYYGVAEPISHYTGWWHTPFNVEPNTPQAKELAFGAVMYEWGIHVWALYALVGLSLAFFSYNKKLPFSIRSVFYPLLKEKIYSFWGDLIDIFAVITTIFGLATSLGLGAQQIVAGLDFLFQTTNTTSMQIALIGIITLIATISVVRGLKNGIRILSNITMVLAIILLLYVIVVSSFEGFLGVYQDTFISYITNIVSFSNFIGREDTTWYHDWSVFYWAWWIAWTPFVGMFIARISKGRTIREFLGAVLFIPTIIILIWMSTFGILGIEQVDNKIGALANGINNISLSTFELLQTMPLSFYSSSLTIFLIIIFFVTSSDSGSLVVDTITSGGKIKTPTKQKIFWALIEGIVAMCLLYVGGKEALSALQAGSLITALPFTIVLLFMCFSLQKGLQKEYKQFY